MKTWRVGAALVLVLFGCSQRTPVEAPKPAVKSEPRSADEVCRADGFDFAYEVPDPSAGVVCGQGPGTPCDLARMQYCDGKIFLSCQWGRMSAVDCRELCSQHPLGLPRSPYEYGYCGQKGGETHCICCDSGDTDCRTEPEFRTHDPGFKVAVPLSPSPPARGGQR